MKIRIWSDGMPIEESADQWMITSDKALKGIKGGCFVDSVFYNWEKIERLEDDA